MSLKTGGRGAVMVVTVAVVIMMVRKEAHDWYVGDTLKVET